MFTPDPTTQAWLENFVRAQGGVAGTVHRRVGDNLALAAAVNIPPPVLAATRTIPQGKGMAGLAWERKAPVQTCNLQEDKSGEVRPGAKAVKALAAIALPVFDAQGEIRAVAGLAFAREGEIGEAAARQFLAAAANLPA
ncbi:MAG TPA: GAF domain-containing protein [Opitutales bacterium]|nr:GAF domain-containing protein [Opitutales bacterium]